VDIGWRFPSKTAFVEFVYVFLGFSAVGVEDYS
jgi:hypothetical protein